MTMFGVLGVAVVVSVAGVLLRRESPALSLCFTIGAVCLLALAWVDDLVEIVNQMQRLLSKTQIESAFLGILLKTLGICYITQFAQDLCKEAGETALAGYVELAGKITVVGLSLPFVSKVVETVINLIEV